MSETNTDTLRRVQILVKLVLLVMRIYIYHHPQVHPQTSKAAVT